MLYHPSPGKSPGLEYISLSEKIINILLFPERGIISQPGAMLRGYRTNQMINPAGVAYIFGTLDYKISISDIT